MTLFILMAPRTKRRQQVRKAITARWNNVQEGDIEVQHETVELFDDSHWMEEVDEDIASNAVPIFLKWSNQAMKHLPGKCPYTSESRTTKWRRANEAAKRIASAHGTLPITQFFNRGPPTPVANDYDDGDSHIAMTLMQCLDKLSTDHVARTSSNKKYDIVSNYDHLRYLSIQRYFLLIKDNNLGKMEASRQACLIMSSRPRDYLSRCIRVWATEYASTGVLRKSQRGMNIKIQSVIHDQDYKNQFLIILRSIKRNMRTAEAFADKIHDKFPQIQISTRTACEWMKKLGWKCDVLKKTVYVDGHEREDVKKDRMQFVEKMLEYVKHMQRYTGAEMDTPIRLPDDCNFLWCVHDESIFDSAGGRIKVWTEKGKPPMLPKRGQSIHVSGIISYNGLESSRIMEPGKNKDGYWRCRDLVQQLEEDIPKISAKNPNTIQIYQFDNSGNHQVYAPDALVQSRLNLGDAYPKVKDCDKAAGIAAKPFRDTFWIDTYGQRRIQKALKRDPNDPTKLIHKGIKSYLLERGLWREKTTIYLPCHSLPTGFQGPTCKEGQMATISRMKLPEAREILASQPDFIEQSKNNWVTETVGHIAIFGAKFHPELAAIEYYWASCKRYTRANCDYTFEGLRRTVPEALHSVSLREIRRHFEHVIRYMKAYQHMNLTNAQIEWAMRKYTSHRRIKDSSPNLDEEFLTDRFFHDMPQDLSVNDSIVVTT